MKLLLALLFATTAFAVDSNLQPMNWGLNGSWSTVILPQSVSTNVLPANPNRAYLEIQNNAINGSTLQLKIGSAITSTEGRIIGGSTAWNPPIPPVGAIYLQSPAGAVTATVIEGIK